MELYLQVLKRLTTMIWKIFLSKYRKKLKIKLLFRINWQTKADDCGRGKSRLGDNSPLLHAGYGPGHTPKTREKWGIKCLELLVGGHAKSDMSDKYSEGASRKVPVAGATFVMSRARKIVTKFHNYSYEIVMSPVIVNSCKNVRNSYQIVK